MFRSGDHHGAASIPVPSVTCIHSLSPGATPLRRGAMKVGARPCSASRGTLERKPLAIGREACPMEVVLRMLDYVHFLAGYGVNSAVADRMPSVV
jgi:hypothetical protein